MSEDTSDPDLLVSLSPEELKARIWATVGLDIGDKDPLQAAQVIYAAAMEDQARLLAHHTAKLEKSFSDQLQLFHTETETVVAGIKEEINAQTVNERIAAMSEQIRQADQLGNAITRATRQFRIFTILNLLSLTGAAFIFFTVFS